MKTNKQYKKNPQQLISWKCRNRGLDEKKKEGCTGVGLDSFSPIFQLHTAPMFCTVIHFFQLSVLLYELVSFIIKKMSASSGFSCGGGSSIGLSMFITCYGHSVLCILSPLAGDHHIWWCCCYLVSGSQQHIWWGCCYHVSGSQQHIWNSGCNLSLCFSSSSSAAALASLSLLSVVLL